MKKTYWIHSVTPLHVGSGRGVGYIDMPVVREKVTNWPYIPGSAIKGVIRDYYADQKLEGFDNAFGKAGSDTALAGALIFTDARIVCLPVRSLYGTFAYVCSPMSIRKLKRDMEMAGNTININIPEIPDNNCAVMDKSKLKEQDKVYLEDLDLSVMNSDIKEIASVISENVFKSDDEKKIFRERFIMVSDNVFDFMCETGTEVNAHIAIDDNTKITKSGALWYEETLPAETILMGLNWTDNKLFKGEHAFCKNDDKLNLQFGGKSSTGKGQCLCYFREGGNK